VDDTFEWSAITRNRHSHALQYRDQRRAKREGLRYRRSVRSRYVRAARTVAAGGIEPLADDNKGPEEGGWGNKCGLSLVILLR
jgi:hypothetical protein